MFEKEKAIAETAEGGRREAGGGRQDLVPEHGWSAAVVDNLVSQFTVPARHFEYSPWRPNDQR